MTTERVVVELKNIQENFRKGSRTLYEERIKSEFCYREV